MNIYVSNSYADGSCSECRRISEQGYRVVVISVNRIRVQLCDLCFAILKKGLAIHAKEINGKAKK